MPIRKKSGSLSYAPRIYIYIYIYIYTRVFQKVVNFTKILDSSHTSHLSMGLTCTEIKAEIWISLSSYIWSGSVMPQQKWSALPVSEWNLELFERPICIHLHIYTYIFEHEFKYWTRLIAFHIALIPLGKVWIQLFSLQLWVNSRVDYLQPWWGN